MKIQRLIAQSTWRGVIEVAYVSAGANVRSTTTNNGNVPLAILDNHGAALVHAATVSMYCGNND